MSYFNTRARDVNHQRLTDLNEAPDSDDRNYYIAQFDDVSDAG
jgi:hypothetical protein